MARVFTTSFLFNHQSYNAIVTVLSKDGKLDITINVLDVDIKEVPGGKLKIECKEDFQDVHIDQSDLSGSMVASITAAIETRYQGQLPKL